MNKLVQEAAPRVERTVSLEQIKDRLPDWATDEDLYEEKFLSNFNSSYLKAHIIYKPGCKLKIGSQYVEDITEIDSNGNAKPEGNLSGVIKQLVGKYYEEIKNQLNGMDEMRAYNDEYSQLLWRKPYAFCRDYFNNLKEAFARKYSGTENITTLSELFDKYGINKVKNMIVNTCIKPADIFSNRSIKDWVKDVYEDFGENGNGDASQFRTFVDIVFTEQVSNLVNTKRSCIDNALKTMAPNLQDMPSEDAVIDWVKDVFNNKLDSEVEKVLAE